MLTVGAMAVVRYAERTAPSDRLVQRFARRKTKVAAVALANKNARTIWAMMASGERHHEPQVA
jgi:transposase